MDEELDILLLEWEERRQRGESPRPESLCGGRLELVAELSRRIELLTAYSELIDTRREVGEAPDLPLPSRVAGYQVLSELGRGGCGVVYKAWDPLLERTVALKMLRPISFPSWASNRERRFRREGQVLAQLKHPHIVPIFAAMLHEGEQCLVMEYVPGGSLAEYRARLAEKGPLAVAAFMEKVARAVHHAHTQGVLHRDLKPGNILLDEAGEPRVSDFGLAKLLADGHDKGEPSPDSGGEDSRASLTCTGGRAGTLPYMAPEQFGPGAGPVSPRTDVWALGVILYELLAGRKPFDPGKQARWEDAVREQSPVPLDSLLPRLDRRLSDIVARCLQKDPGQRYPTAAALSEDLARLARRRARPRLVSLGILGTMLTAGLFALPAAREAPSEPPQRVPSGRVYQKEIAGAVEALASGRPVELVQAGREPAAFAWREGGLAAQWTKKISGDPALYSPVLCLAELLPHVPCRSYKIEAVLKHVYCGSVYGEVGVYFSYSQPSATAARQHRFAYVKFGDVGESATAAADRGIWGSAVDLGYYWTNDLSQGPLAGSRCVCPHHFEVPPPAPRGFGPSRHLEIGVSPEGVTCTFDGKAVGFQEWCRVEIEKEVAEIAAQRPHWNNPGQGWFPSNPLGLYVYQGAIVCERFAITPAR